MFLETPRLYIRSLKPADAPAYIALASDGSLSEIFGDCRNCAQWMPDWIKEAIALDKQNNPRKDYLAYAICLRGEDTPIGSVGCSYYADLQRVGITYFIGAAHRGQGYAAEAARAYAAHFLSHYDEQELIATVRAENTASIKVIESAGFRRIKTQLYRDLNDEKEELYHFYTHKQA